MQPAAGTALVVHCVQDEANLLMWRTKIMQPTFHLLVLHMGAMLASAQPKQAALQLADSDLHFTHDTENFVLLDFACESNRKIPS